MKQITETRLWINGIFMGGQVMKILAFDIGGTAIKYSICEDDKLLNVNEIPTNAMMGARHVMDT